MRTCHHLDHPLMPRDSNPHKIPKQWGLLGRARGAGQRGADAKLAAGEPLQRVADQRGVLRRPAATLVCLRELMHPQHAQHSRRVPAASLGPNRQDTLRAS